MRLMICVTMLLCLALMQHAFTIPAGTCQELLLFNESSNSSYNDTACAENATTINVTNVTVQQCNATNGTLASNTTGTFNNATVTCLPGNATVIVNNTTIVQGCSPKVAIIRVSPANITATANENNFSVLCIGENMVVNSTTTCPAINRTMYANDTETFNNATVKCLTDSGSCPAASCPSIPVTFCYENRREEAQAPYIFRSAVTNSTYSCQVPAQAACQPCTGNATYNATATASCQQSVTVPATPYCLDGATPDEISYAVKGDWKGIVQLKTSALSVQLQAYQSGAQTYQTQIAGIKDELNRTKGDLKTALDDKKSTTDTLHDLLFYGAIILGCMTLGFAGLMIMKTVEEYRFGGIGKQRLAKPQKEIDDFRDKGKEKWKAQ